MSLTIEFYSAEPQELKALFAGDTPLDTFVQKRQTFPHADFSFHLLLPDDLDNLCQILSMYHPLVPLRFQDVCVAPLWDDGFGTESLTILSKQFARALQAYGGPGPLNLISLVLPLPHLVQVGDSRMFR